jgi:hypothetical protein
MQWAVSERSHHFLSDGEADAFAFITMLPNIVDVREQVPLALDMRGHQLAAYDFSHVNASTLGTLACAELLRIKHPLLRGKGTTQPWIMSTDFVVTLQPAAGRYELLAVSVKPRGELTNGRTCQLLQLERMYWEQQGVQWILITPSVYQKEISTTVRMAMPWAVPKLASDRVPIEQLSECVKISPMFDGSTLTSSLAVLQSYLTISMEAAQRTLWQAVWAGAIPLNLHRSAWPSEPLRLLDIDAFREQNPIAARRSTCF